MMVLCDFGGSCSHYQKEKLKGRAKISLEYFIKKNFENISHLTGGGGVYKAA